MKRLMDVSLSFVFLILSSPVLLIIAAIIFLHEPGSPVLFRQRRVGRHNRNFSMLKFRTMRVDTPDIPTDRLSNPGVYLTSVGRWLRKTSLDELPQLFNVLAGEMSLVGPRPALYNQDELIAMRTRAGVHVLSPGITGWAQIHGRDEITNLEKVRLDADYLKNYSVLTDAKILVLTVFRVVRANGIKA